MTQFSTPRSLHVCAVCTTGCVAEQMFSVGSISRASEIWPFFFFSIVRDELRNKPCVGIIMSISREREKNACDDDAVTVAALSRDNLEIGPFC